MSKLELNNDELDLMIYCVNEALEEEFKNQFSTQLQWDLEVFCDKLTKEREIRNREPILDNIDFLNCIAEFLIQYNHVDFIYKDVNYKLTDVKEIDLLDGLYTIRYKDMTMDVRKITLCNA